MAVAFNSVTSTSGSGTSSGSVTHSAPSWASIVIVDVALRTTTVTVSALTYGGVSIVGNAISGSPVTGTNCKIYSFYVLNPATGSQTVALTLSTTVEWVMAVRSFSGVNQATPFGTGVTATGSAAISQAVTAPGNQLVIDMLAMQYAQAGVIAAGAGQTQDYVVDSSTGTPTNSKESGAGSHANTVGNATMTWTNPNGRNYAYIGIPLIPAMQAIRFIGGSR